MTAPQAARFTMQNAQQTDVTLTCMDALGGVSVTLTGGTLEQEQMAQVRFELLASDGQTTDLALTDGAFYAGQLAAGTYVLRQTQMPEGYTLSGEQTVTVAGGEVQRVRVPLEEYALLSVSKTGLTFNDKLQTYVVPLTGEYGVYTMENGSLLPYPSASEQTTVWANAAPSEKKRCVQETAVSCAGMVTPASMFFTSSPICSEIACVLPLWVSACLLYTSRCV